MKHNLMPGDVLLTYKKPPSWNLLQQFFDSRIENKGYKKYGWLCNYAECNHVRVYIGEGFSKPWIFEHTFPASRFDELKDWMLQPEYCRIFRLKDEWQNHLMYSILWKVALGNTGSMYDFMQLVDMWIGWGKVLDLGRTMRVCSTGARFLLESACEGLDLFPDTPLHKTLPCAFANNPDMFYEITDNKDDMFRLSPEPVCERCVAL